MRCVESSLPPNESPRLVRSEPAFTSRREFIGGVAAAAMAPRAFAAAAKGIPILTYHRFDPRRAASTTVTTGTFELQLGALVAAGFEIATLARSLSALRSASIARQAVITVDDGHVSIYTQLFPIVRRLGFPLTLFIYPSIISNRPDALTWKQLGDMRKSGLVDVQSHTYWHPNFRRERGNRTPAALAGFVDDQLQRSRRVLETRLGAHVDMLAWPFGIVDRDLELAARRAGYIAGFGYSGGSAKPGDDILALPRIPISEADRGRAFARKIGFDFPKAG